jgi:hypothetical protein
MNRLEFSNFADVLSNLGPRIGNPYSSLVFKIHTKNCEKTHEQHFVEEKGG